jgi:hypothetical protein
MNSLPHRKTYGTLSLSSALVRAIQLEWDMVERPSPQARFMNFPLADPVSASAPAQPARKSKTRLAA